MPKLELTRLDESKPWYKSKTVWFNIITILSPVVDALVGSMYLIEPLIAPGLYPFIMLGVGLVNIVLRRLTDNAVRFTERGSQEYGGDWRNGRDDVFVD